MKNEDKTPKKPEVTSPENLEAADTDESIHPELLPGWPLAEPSEHGREWPPAEPPRPIAHDSGAFDPENS